MFSFLDDSGKGVDTRHTIDSRNKSNQRMTRSRKMSSKERRKHPKEKKLTKNTKNEKNKDQVMKHKKYNSPRQSPTPCQDIACLNNLLQVLKLSKDNVVNFIAQEKRLQSRLDIAGKILNAIHPIL